MKRWVTWLGIAVSGALLYIIATQFDLPAALNAIRMADPFWLGLSTVAYTCLFVLRGYRWRVLLSPIKPVTTRAATEVFLIGFMANNLLPARLGDVARAFVLARREQVPASATFSNVMLERIFDGLTVVGFLCAVLLLEPPTSGAAWVQPVGIGMAVLFAGALLAAVLIARSEAQVVRLARLCLGWLPPEILDRLLGLVAKLAKGLHTLRSARQTGTVLSLSLLVWSLEVLVYVLLQNAFGMSVSVLGMALVMSILTLGLTAPSAPGFIGVFEGLVIVGVTLFGVNAPRATAFAITLHLIHYIPGTLFGLAFAWSSGLRLGELRSAGEEPAEQKLPSAVV